MKKNGCPYLPMVQRALKRDEWDAETRRHFDGCTDCQEMARIRAFLGDLATSPEEVVPPTESQLIWIQARFEERQLAQKKALRPIVYVQTAFQFLFGIGFVIMAFRHWADVERWFQSLPNGGAELLTLAGRDDLSVSLIFCAATLVCLSLLAVFDSFGYRR